MNRNLIAVALVLSLFVGATRAQDQDLVESGQKLVKSYSNAVINISATIKLTISGAGATRDPIEQKQEVLATIIDPTGLAVTSLMSIDPGSSVRTIRGRGRGGESVNVNVKSDVSDVKYRFADGTEISGRIVLKDEDLDLAFIAPEKAVDDATKGKFTSVSLEGATEAVQLLEPIISIGRLDKNLSYEPAVNAARLSAKLTKPRLEYVAGGAVGGPSFTRDGKLLGICLMHRSGGPDVDANAPRAQRDSTQVIIPAADIAEVAVQAKEEMNKPQASTNKSDAPATQPAEDK